METKAAVNFTEAAAANSAEVAGAASTVAVALAVGMADLAAEEAAK